MIQTLASIKLAVVLFALIALVSIYGTTWEDQALARERIFQAPWFMALLSLFALNLIACTIKRKVIRLSKASLLMTHASILFILAGAIMTGVLGERGWLYLWEHPMGVSEKSYFMLEGGSPSLPYAGRLDLTDEHLAQKGYCAQQLGFGLRLEDFEVEYYPPPIVIKLQGEEGHQTLTLEEGAQRSTNGLKIRVEEYFPNYMVDEKVVKASDELRNPAYRVAIRSPESGANKAECFEQWLIALDAERRELVLADPYLRISFSWLVGREELDGAIREASSPPPERLRVTVAGGEEEEFPVEPGRRHSVEGTPYAIEILRYEPDFARRDAADKRGIPPNNPALQVRIGRKGEQGEEVEDRWVFARFPEWERRHKVRFSDVSLAYQRAEGNAIRILGASGAAGRLLILSDGIPVVNVELKPDRTYDVAGGTYEVKFPEFIPDALIETTEGTHGSIPLNPAMRIVLNGAGSPREMLLVSRSRDWSRYGDWELMLAGGESATIKSFKSHVSVIEEGKIVKKATIEVNRPLTHGGYSFYQSTYDKEGHAWTGLDVVRDPGVPLVYAGFALLSVGLVWTFYRRALRT